MQWPTDAIQTCKYPLWSHMMYSGNSKPDINADALTTLVKSVSGADVQFIRGWPVVGLRHLEEPINQMRCCTDCIVVIHCSAARIHQTIAYVVTMHFKNQLSSGFHIIRHVVQHICLPIEF